jgi:GH15 family glucan-1,4-alpha-glucosidase
MRTDGYLALRDYAVVGDGRTSALVGLDGSVDWLCLPNVDSAPVFDRILDAEQGGCFELRPAGEFTAKRRYRDGTNVLETTFRARTGSARVTDAMTLHDRTSLAPLRELVRIVDGLEGHVELSWRFTPRLDFGRRELRLADRAGARVAVNGKDAFALSSWGAGEGDFTVAPGERVTFALTHAHMEPLVLPDRLDAEHRVEEAASFWSEWSSRLRYEGPWRDAVVRSALALKLLAFSPSGCIVAAPTTSLPERLGGDRNWDYRFGWIRDGIFTLRALLALGCVDEARAFFWWQMHATRTTEPELRPLYRVDGRLRADEVELDVPGYRGSAPVRVGNAAADQLQLDPYGPLVEGAWRFHSKSGSLGAARPKELAGLADYVAETWRQPDSGIWESRDEPRAYVQSKAMCWTALDRAVRMADAGVIPDRREWRDEAERIRDWIEHDGWDESRGTYRCAAGSDVLDASLLSLALCAYADASESRFGKTVEAIRAELGRGPFLYRFSGAEEIEGAFLTCSFWLVDALARAGRRDEAAALMDELVGAANHVGLYAEQVDRPPASSSRTSPSLLPHRPRPLGALPSPTRKAGRFRRRRPLHLEHRGTPWSQTLRASPLSDRVEVPFSAKRSSGGAGCRARPAHVEEGEHLLGVQAPDRLGTRANAESPERVPDVGANRVG